jgi:hypothetical protein
VAGSREHDNEHSRISSVAKERLASEERLSSMGDWLVG